MENNSLKKITRFAALVLAVGIACGLIFQPNRLTGDDKSDKSNATKEKTTNTAVAAQSSEKVAKSGSQLWSENCARCHNMRSSSAYNDAEWDVVMHHMRIRAILTAEEHKKILEFLKSAH